MVPECMTRWRSGAHTDLLARNNATNRTIVVGCAALLEFGMTG